MTKWSKEKKKKIRYILKTINVNQPFHSPDVEPGLTEWDTCARAGLGLLATEDPVPGVPLGPPFMVYVGGGGRLEAVSILELRTSMSAFCNKPEHKVRAQHSKCTYTVKSLLESCLDFTFSPSPSVKIQIKAGEIIRKSKVHIPALEGQIFLHFLFLNPLHKTE